MMMYTALVKDPETKEVKIINSEYSSKSDFAKDLRSNGYQVKFITTPDNFDKDSEKYHERLEKARIYAKAKRETEKSLKRIQKKAEEQLTAEEPEKESADEMTEDTGKTEENAETKNHLIVLNEIPATKASAIKYAPINFYKYFITAFTDTTNLNLKFIKEVIPRPPNASTLKTEYFKLF